jgi:hypothetical protein
MTHDCKQTYNLKTADGTLVGPYRNYTCSRCGKCYVCQHVSIQFSNGDWMWKCNGRIFNKVILDGKVPHDRQ